MRQLKIIRIIPGRNQKGWEIEVADGPSHIAVYGDNDRYAVSRLKDGEWKLVASHHNAASVEAYLPPGWTFQKLMILVEGYEQGVKADLFEQLTRQVRMSAAQPPRPPARIRLKLALERLTVPIRRFYDAFTERSE
jgi:hypothetical protein